MNTSRRVAGCDLGKAAAKLVLAEVDDDGRLSVLERRHAFHAGQPLEVLRGWYEELELSSCAAVAATGLHAGELALPGLPADACLRAAVEADAVFAGPVNVVRVGARGYSVLTRDASGHFQSLHNDKCSSGTGETMVKIAGRFGITIEAADALALGAKEAIPITARCSVFAKSEMTHLGNEGRPADALFKGYFGAVAHAVASLLSRARADGPVWATGGGAQLGALVEALASRLEVPVEVPAHALHLEAEGAARLAATMRVTDPLPASFDTLVRPVDVNFASLPAARGHAHRVRRLEAAPVPEGAALRPCVLGLDLGSTGSKAVLTTIDDGRLVLDLYDRTRGNPVEAALRLVRTLLDQIEPDVRAIGVTGSGREAVATVLRAAWPEHSGRVVVRNEIVAHATAAIRCDEDAGESLSVVEIGGQDAKFIQIAGGQIVESDLNKACSAGTGSFLEEQAVFHGVDDIGEFTRLAAEATAPPDLGQMCTVFVADAAGEAHNAGFGRAELFGGYQYSVVHNYLHRVMGQRTFGRRIFFQGKPATGASLPWTLAAVTGREVVVPPNPGAMGAWGIGLLVSEAAGADALLSAAPLDLRAALDARVVGRSEFQCRDKRCATLCSIERTAIEVGGTRRTVLSGGACPKYEVSSLGAPSLPLEAPSAFDERRALLAPFLSPRDDGPVVGIPLVGALHGYVPYLVTLVSELGLGVRVLEADAGALARGEGRCYAYDACAPVKTAHGLELGDVDVLFFPKLLSAGAGGSTCPVEQALPEMVRESLQARGGGVKVVSPPMRLEAGWLGLRGAVQAVDAAGRLVRATGVNLDGARLARAARSAAASQATYESALRAIGSRTLGYARAQGRPVVAVCGPQHVIHDRVLSAGVPRLLRRNGVLALPMDCYPVPDGVEAMPRVAWSEANQALRVAVAGRRRGDVYPLMLSSFGCGPASFVEAVFTALMEGHPHTVIESDGHGGEAGYVTRVQAFLHTVDRHEGRGSTPPAERMRLLDPPPDRPVTEERGRRLVLFGVSDGISPVLAASYRAYGFDAVAAGPAGPENHALGRQDCSGKECLPYQLIWGGFREQLEAEPSRPTTLVQVTGQGMCRNCMFSLRDELTLQSQGQSDRVDVRHLGSEDALGWTFLARAHLGLVAWDLLYQLVAYHRADARDEAALEAMYEGLRDELFALVERPAGSVGRRSTRLAKLVRDVERWLDRASRAFADQVTVRGLKPTVLITGDIYLRVDAFASNDLARRLADHGLRVVVDPASSTVEYMAQERLAEIVGLPTDRVGNALVRLGVKVGPRLRALVRTRHPWLPETAPRQTLRAAGALLERYPQGEAPLAVGTVLHQWETGRYDGAVVVGPWGCGPAIVTESLLRHRRDIPSLFFYGDGTPLDPSRLAAFAFELKRGHGEPGEGARAM